MMSLSMPNLNQQIKQNFEMRANQIKANIRNLQNQLLNELTPGVGAGMGKSVGGMQSNDFFKSNNDLYGLSNDNAGPGGAAGGGSQGSRLLSWKSYNKQQSNEDKMNSLDFIRAPGGLSKQNSTPGNWGNFMGDESGGWPSDMTKHDKADLAGGLDEYSLSSNFPVQDTFDSYKSTWKPTAKSGLVDDDPRSPISQNAMLKDSMFSWNGVGSTNANPKANSLLGGNGQGQMDSLNSSFGFGGGSNNPWSYSGNNGNGGQSGNSQMFNDMNKKPMGKNTWGNQGLNSDYSDSLWTPGASNGASGGNGNSGAGKPRPPPGLSKNSNPSSSNSIWNSGLSSSSGSSEYLRLRNLTPQVSLFSFAQ